MEPQEQQAEVTPGAILAALTILDAMRRDEEHLAARVDEIADLLQVWGTTAITQAYGWLIYGAMSAITSEEGEPDRLHTVVPAVLTKLGKIQSARPFLATMAGVLTAAAVGDDIWQWRQSLGAVTKKETAAWCWTAWLLADLIDSGYEEPGRFVREATRIVTEAVDGAEPPA